MRTPTLASTTDMQGGSFEEPGSYMYPFIRPHTYLCTRASRVDGETQKRGLGMSVESFLSDGFNEGI